MVSGVGHETDYTIADDVADQRAPTPSAAAELVTPDGAQLLANAQAGRLQALRSLGSIVSSHRSAAAMLEQRLRRRAPDVALLLRQVDDLHARAASRVLQGKELWQRDVATLTARLTALEPGATLRRGYAVVNRTSDGVVVTRPIQVATGDRL